jgi:hypothetical protein
MHTHTAQRTKPSLQILKNLSMWENVVSGPWFFNDWCGKTTVRGTMEAGKNSVIYMGLILGPNKADDTCGKTTEMNATTLVSDVCCIGMHCHAEWAHFVTDRKFRPLKHHLGGWQFHNNEEVKVAVYDWLPMHYHYNIFKHVQRWDKFINTLENCVKIMTLQLNTRATFNVLISSQLNFMTQETLLIEHSL